MLPDLHAWKRCGTVFPKIPDWIQQLSPATLELWAPDISFFDGVYHLYYAFSEFGKNTSGIALATNETLDPTSPKYKWVDRGLVLQSLVTDDFNAIDPNLVLDRKGGGMAVLRQLLAGNHDAPCGWCDRPALEDGHEDLPDRLA